MNPPVVLDVIIDETKICTLYFFVVCLRINHRLSMRTIIDATQEVEIKMSITDTSHLIKISEKRNVSANVLPSICSSAIAFQKFSLDALGLCGRTLHTLCPLL